MALWLIRAGKYGEHEQRFFADSACYLTWEGTEDRVLHQAKDYEGIKALLADLYPDEKPKTRINWASQIAPFVFDIQPGDWVVVPHKHKPAIAFGEVTKGYAFDANADQTYRHSIRVKWLNIEVPRSAFDQDLLYSFGAFMTVCRMARNDAEVRVRAMAKAGWNAPAAGAMAPTPGQKTKPAPDDPPLVIEEHFDVERSARDQITKLVLARFKGHGMAELVGAILRAQGFSTHISPPGPDGGIDILAAPGTFGFSEPRICVQVKSQQSPIERTVLDALGGVMKKVNATHGLLVCWGGFKSSIDRDETQQFFHVRLWDADDLIDELLGVYDKLDADRRALIPLKRVWTLAAPDEA
jgi:restriction system protein